LVRGSTPNCCGHRPPRKSRRSPAASGRSARPALQSTPPPKQLLRARPVGRGSFPDSLPRIPDQVVRKCSLAKANPCPAPLLPGASARHWICTWPRRHRRSTRRRDPSQAGVRRPRGSKAHRPAGGFGRWSLARLPAVGGRDLGRNLSSTRHSRPCARSGDALVSPPPRGSLFPLRGRTLPSEVKGDPGRRQRRCQETCHRPMPTSAGPTPWRSRSAARRPCASCSAGRCAALNGRRATPPGRGVPAGWTPWCSLGRAHRPTRLGPGAGFAGLGRPAWEGAAWSGPGRTTSLSGCGRGRRTRNAPASVTASGVTPRGAGAVAVALSACDCGP